MRKLEFSQGPGQACLGTWHLNRELKEVREEPGWGGHSQAESTVHAKALRQNQAW